MISPVLPCVTEWSWNYPYTDVKTEIKNGKLSLSGTPKPGVKTGAALCLRAGPPRITRWKQPS